MALFGKESGDVTVGVGVNVGLTVGEGVLLEDGVPCAGTVAVPVPATLTVVACTGGCKIVQTKKLAESMISIPSAASNGISLLFAKTCCCGAGGCGKSAGFCSGGLLPCCVNACVNFPLFKFHLYPFKLSYQYCFARE